ncbi:hypothetical protein [Aminobacter sp. J44]|uniref:hypothetical protein n=1 Tax=Aminobacter sp. J44 TaxID=935262 RepID=UPI0011991100|nr:hypothetical protein [Aminobacter sp. J44]TWG49544.1 hypothetical protein L610_007100000020 [Aminobacter sp. J44]
MAQPSSVTVFLFAYVRSMPRSSKEFAALSAIKAQHKAIRKFASANGVQVLRTFFDATTHRGSHFLNSDVFADAVRFACENDAPLLVGDIKALIASAKKNVLEVMDRVDLLNCDLFDASTGKSWKNFTGMDRSMIAGEAVSLIKRGRAISRGLGGTIERSASLTENQKRGAASNRRKAQRRAEKLKPVIEELRASLAPGHALTPSVVASRLNDLQIPATRGGKWTYNTAKRLLDRIGEQ